MSDDGKIRAIHAGVLLTKPTEAQRPALKVRRPRPMTGEEARNRELWRPWPFGEMPPEEIASFMRVNVTTARRWRRTRTLPKSAQLLAHTLITGDLGPVDSAWAGWCARNGALHSTFHRSPLTVSELEFLPFTAQRVASLQATIRRLEAELANAKEHARQETPGHEEREALKVSGEAELLMRMAFAVNHAIERAEHESVNALAPEAIGIARAVAALVVKLHTQRTTREDTGSVRNAERSAEPTEQ